MADFQQVRDESGKLVKMKADISNFKSVVVNEYNNSSYCHISDVSKCFGKGGSFDIKKSKSVTLNRDDVDNFVKMIDQIPTVMDQVLAESVHYSDSDGSSSNDIKQINKKNKVRKQKQKQSCKRQTHDVSDQSETSSSEREEAQTTKIRKSKVKKQRKTGHPYASVRGELQHRNKTRNPKKATKAIFKKTKPRIDSGSDTEVFTD